MHIGHNVRGKTHAEATLPVVAAEYRQIISAANLGPLAPAPASFYNAAPYSSPSSPPSLLVSSRSSPLPVICNNSPPSPRRHLTTTAPPSNGNSRCLPRRSRQFLSEKHSILIPALAILLYYSAAGPKSSCGLHLLLIMLHACQHY